jgi:hypothetical protein
MLPSQRWVAGAAAYFLGPTTLKAQRLQPKLAMASAAS